MNISIDILFQVGALICTVISVVWYISNTLGVINNKIDKSNQLNEHQEKKLEQVQASVNECSKACKDGRIKLWEEVNNMKVQIAKIEATKDK